VRIEWPRRLRRHRVALILQTEAAECGVACLAMVSAFHGGEQDLGSLRRRFSPSPKGMRLTELMEMASMLGLAARPVKLDLPGLRFLSLPAILHWDFNHFVVLTRVSGNGVEIFDPAQGRKQLDLDAVSRHFTGVALELRTLPTFERRHAPTSVSFAQLLGHWPGFVPRVVRILLLSFLLEAATIAAPLFSQLVMDKAVPLGNRELVVHLAVGFLLLICIQTALSASRSWLMSCLGTEVSLRMVGNLFQHLIRLPITFFERRHLGEITSRFESLNAIQRTLTAGFLLSILDGLMALATLGMMFFYSAALTLIVLTAATLYALARMTLYRAHRMAIQAQIARGAEQQSHLLESIRGAQSIKLFGRESARGGAWQNLAVSSSNSALRTQGFVVAYQALNTLLFGAESILVMSVGAFAILGGTMTVGRLFAFIAFRLQFVNRIGSLTERAIDYSLLSLHRERVADIVLSDREPESLAASELPACPPSLTLVNVSFRYAPTEPLVLDNVNLHIDAGDFVAITGPSGCGKTTLMKVMLGLLEPTSGELRIDGIPVHRVGVKTWRSVTASVMQEDTLFAGSIADNIGFFDNPVDMPRVRRVTELAQIRTDIEAMPMGYETLVGDMGGLVSGGQRQRLLLARALYREPRALFLDEATSHLDGERESYVNAAIGDIKLTRVIIAHRAETIRAARRVINFPLDTEGVAGRGAAVSVTAGQAT